MKQFAFGDVDEGQSVVTIEHDGQLHNPDEGYPRQWYRYTITTEKWEYSAADIYGAENEGIELDKAAQSLFAFLCLKPTEFPENVRVWASHYIDEIAWLATPPEQEDPTMAMRNGQLVPSDEEGVDF